MNLLIYPAVKPHELEQLAAVSDELEIINTNSEDEALDAIVEADAMYGHISPEMLARATKLRWLQTPIAGLENYMFPELVESDVTMSNMSGIYSDMIAEHTMTYVLMFARGFHTYLRYQMEHKWQKGVPVMHLTGKTLGIIGLGGIGTEIARRAKAFEMRVIATEARPRPAPEFVDEVWPSERLNDLLEQSDFVISCVPHTPETVGLIGAAELARMKESAYLINISRGVVVKLDALADALRNGVIAGAGLDVYEIEPLPADHPLWGMENVIMTPHVAAADTRVAQRRVDVVKENLQRFLQGEPPKNLIDKRMWF